MPRNRAEKDSTDLAERLARSYSALIRGFNWVGSEGHDPYRAFSAPFASAAKLTPVTFRAAGGITNGAIRAARGEPAERRIGEASGLDERNAKRFLVRPCACTLRSFLSAATSPSFRHLR
jgi:hypothetical protein